MLRRAWLQTLQAPPDCGRWRRGLGSRGATERAARAPRGTDCRPGARGRVMQGGAWLRWADDKVDATLRDPHVADYCPPRAKQGKFESDALLWYQPGTAT